MAALRQRVVRGIGCGCVVALTAACSGTIPSMSALPAGAGAALGTLAKAVAERPSLGDTEEQRMAQENGRKFEAENEMWNDPLLEAYVTAVVQRIVAVAKPRPFAYRMRIVKSPSINAFTFGGGLLYVNAGLLGRVDNEAQLAMVLAHEIAHVTERHVPKGIETAYGLQVAAQLATQAAPSAPLPADALQKAYDYAMNAAVNGHGRRQETEADEVGLDYMTRAGYDPRESPHTFEVLLKEYGDSSAIKNFFWENHPTNTARIERTTWLVKDKYGAAAAGRQPVVDTDEFRQRTRGVVVALGLLDYNQKRFDGARAMFEKAARVDAADARPHYYLGKIALDTGVGRDAIDGAIAHLVSATAANPLYAPAYRELGLAYSRQGDTAKAVAALTRYVTLAPNSDDAGQIHNAIRQLQRQ